MKINEFIPITKKGRDIRKAEKAGAADAIQSVSDLETEFAGILGGQGKKFNTATTDDVIAFLKSKNVDTSRIDTSEPMNPKRINKVFSVLIKDKMSGANLSNPKDAGQSIDSIKDAISKLNPKQRAAIRSQLSKTAGVA